jgi:malonyl CoA-acyl carrier protein transacylase
MAKAQLEFEAWVADVPFSSPTVPLVFNATAATETDPQVIRNLVTRQLTQPVYWRKCMDAIRASGVDTLYEVGPQRVLSGLARINGFKKGAVIHNINNLRGIERVHETVTAAV